MIEPLKFGPDKGAAIDVVFEDKDGNMQVSLSIGDEIAYFSIEDWRWFVYCCYGKECLASARMRGKYAP